MRCSTAGSMADEPVRDQQAPDGAVGAAHAGMLRASAVAVSAPNHTPTAFVRPCTRHRRPRPSFPPVRASSPDKSIHPPAIATISTMTRDEAGSRKLNHPSDTRSGILLARHLLPHEMAHQNRHSAGIGISNQVVFPRPAGELPQSPASASTISRPRPDSASWLFSSSATIAVGTGGCGSLSRTSTRIRSGYSATAAPLHCRRGSGRW